MCTGYAHVCNGLRWLRARVFAAFMLENTAVFNYTLREPVGVVGIITPWNFPLLILSFSLAAGIWTNDIKRARRVARELKAGTVWINTSRAVSYASSFGAYKHSGYGREMGMETIREFTQVKSVWVDLADTVPDPFALR